MPPSPPRMFAFILALATLAIFVQIGLINIAFEKLGLSERSAYLLLMCTLAGSFINLPLLTLKADNKVLLKMPMQMLRWPFSLRPPLPGRISVSVNVGGALVPVGFSLYLLGNYPMNPTHLIATVAVVAFIANRVSWPIPGIGIGMPTLIAPFAAALMATFIEPQLRAPLAYIGGTLGVLIGADLLRLNDIRKLGVPFASIGGAGAFDGVYVSGLLAVLLA